MKVLGLGGSTHDFAFCLVEDGEIITAISEERLSKEKHAIGRRSQLFSGMKYCMDKLNISDIDLLITNDLFERFSITQRDESYVHKIISINHHMAHASSSYYTSPFSEAACLVIDGNGTFYNELKCAEIMSMGYANNEQINLTDTFYSDVNNYETHSLGHFYLHMTYKCGFFFGEEGKVMGLAPYGSDRYVKAISNCMDIDKHIYFNQSVRDTVEEILDNKTYDQFQLKADLAYAAQQLLEENVFRIMNDLYKKNKTKNLCYSGGIALNCALNGKIKEKTPFENVYIFPDAGDSGTAVGAALYGYYELLKQRTQHHKAISHVFYGKNYDESIIYKELMKFTNEVQYQKYNDSDLLQQTAADLADGKIIGWFQGGSEIGPRALGNRSILANPAIKDMKDIINNRVKFRENFRPFAPAVLEQKVNEYFDTDFPDNPFMLYIGIVKPNKRDQIPAVTHVDGTARLQTVSEKSNKKFYDLICEFEKRTGVPILLNTSFNIKGLPIVEVVSDAIKCLLYSQLDSIVIGNFIVVRKENKI